jgi:hypothetical protein
LRGAAAQLFFYSLVNTNHEIINLRTERLDFDVAADAQKFCDASENRGFHHFAGGIEVAACSNLAASIENKGHVGTDENLRIHIHQGAKAHYMTDLVAAIGIK